MTFKPVDRVPILLRDIWPDTMTRWLQEGYPEGVDPEEYFEVEPFRTAYIGPHSGLYPEPAEKIIEETETTIIKTDRFGRTVRDFKDHTSMPERLVPVIEDGGFMPSIDHSVSADISLANYTYFIKALKQACGW